MKGHVSRNVVTEIFSTFIPKMECFWVQIQTFPYIIKDTLGYGHYDL